MSFDPTALTDEQLAAAQQEQMARRAREQQEKNQRRQEALAPLVEAGLSADLVTALEAAKDNADLRDLEPHIRAALTGLKTLVVLAGPPAVDPAPTGS